MHHHHRILLRFVGVKQIGTAQYIVEVNDRPMVRLRCTRLYIYIYIPYLFSPLAQVPTLYVCSSQAFGFCVPLDRRRQGIR